MSDHTLCSEALELIAEHRRVESHVNATDARQRFFQLLDQVVSDEKAVVYVGHKDLPLRGAIVSEAFLDYVHKLEEITSALAEHSTAPFSLIGTATAEDRIENALAELRASQRSQDDKRATRLPAK